MLFVALLATSCSSTSRNIFRKKTPHEEYAEKLDDKDLDKTPGGRQWLAASKLALEDAQLIQLPYRQLGYFAPGKARALGLRFMAKRGEKLTFTLNKKSAFIIYADLYREGGGETNLLLSADTAASQFSFDIDESGAYVLRLQPELFRAGEYSLSVSVGPSIGFPVGADKGKVGSVWGDSRGGGKRRHEGIDIFAPKRTPVVAAADGVVTGVKEEGIGGKTVWMRMEKNISLYYAHLDKQLVHVGQLVQKGEIIGTVGNTGNAKHTPSHLHFGIYTYAGPIDPLPFVNKEIKTAAPVPDKKLTGYLRLIKTQKLGNENTSVAANTLLVPMAVTAHGYISELPDGKMTRVSFAAVQPVLENNKKNMIAAKNKNRDDAGL